MIALTNFERFMLAQPVADLQLPAVRDSDDVALWKRAWILGYGYDVPRGEDSLRLLAMLYKVLPASEQELADAEKWWRQEVNKFVVRKK